MRFRVLSLLAAALPLSAHVGSPDVFLSGNAGPYALIVTIRPPEVVPGVAAIEIRSLSPGVRSVHIVPLRLGSPGQLAPVSDLARPAPEDPQFYTGALWLMATGSWQVRIDVEGDRGSGTLSVPVPALATKVLGMQTTTALILLPLALVLCLGVVSIAGAAVREAQLDPGVEPDAPSIRRSRVVMVGAALFVAACLWLGSMWWNSEDGFYRRYIFKPLRLSATVQSNSVQQAGSRLVLRLDDPGWLNRQTGDLLPDHGHLMHLYVIRMPHMDMVWHLHPERHEDEDFTQALPAMPAGRYALFGDIVHANGLPETATGEITLPTIAGTALTGDDAGGAGPPIADADYTRTIFPLSDGYRMVWARGSGPLRARQPNVFQFRIEDAAGNPARDMEFYMGMLGHAAFVRTDLSVFAHVHPSGSVPMPAMELAQPVAASMPMGPMYHDFGEYSGLPAQAGFPYGFPTPGKYRIFVQMKHGGKIETGMFDAQVEK